MDNIIGFMGAFYLIPSLIIGMIGFLLGWFLKPSKSVNGDLSIEGEGALRAEADSLRARVQDLEGRVSGRDQEVSDLKTKLASNAAAPAAADATAKTSDSDDTYALEWQNRYLAARVKYLDSRLAELGDTGSAKAATAKKPTKKAAAKKTTAKSKAVAKPKKTTVTKATAAKAVTAKKAPAKKAPTKKAPVKKTAAKKAPAKKAAPKTAAAKKAPTKKAPAKKAAAPKKAAPKKAPAKAAAASKAMSKDEAAFERYYTKVKAFDPRASRKVVQNIVTYCGASLKSRDSSLVACGDESELRTVANGFVTKKLGIKDGQMDLVKSVCEQMKGQRLKSRVTFYYLTAKKARKLSLFN